MPQLSTNAMPVTVSSTGVGLGLLIVTVLAALVLPTTVLGKMTAGDWSIDPLMPVPLSDTVTVPPGESEGKLIEPVNVVAALAVKSTLTLQLWPGLSVWPEHPSVRAGIANCEGLTVTVPMRIGLAELFTAVSILAGDVVVPVPVSSPTTEAVKITL
jgi:hypothetical protein